MQYIPLTQLNLTKTATISGIHISGELRRRLLDLGFAPGTSVTPLFKSPLGDPTAFEVMGSVVALRKEDAENIRVMYQKEDTQ